jgi:hypothetical protein
MADPRVTIIEDGKSALLERPVCFTDAQGRCRIELERIKYWLAGSRGGMDPDDPRKQSLPGIAGEWIFVVGGPVSREYDDAALTYKHDGVIRTDEEVMDISWAYFDALTAHYEYLKTAMVINPKYAQLRHAQWQAQNPMTNSEAFNETPLPIESIPPFVLGGA